MVIFCVCVCMVLVLAELSHSFIHFTFVPAKVMSSQWEENTLQTSSTTLTCFKRKFSHFHFDLDSISSEKNDASNDSFQHNSWHQTSVCISSKRKNATNNSTKYCDVFANFYYEFLMCDLFFGIFCRIYLSLAVFAAHISAHTNVFVLTTKNNMQSHFAATSFHNDRLANFILSFNALWAPEIHLWAKYS